VQELVDFHEGGMSFREIMKKIKAACPSYEFFAIQTIQTIQTVFLKCFFVLSGGFGPSNPFLGALRKRGSTIRISQAGQTYGQNIRLGRLT